MHLIPHHLYCVVILFRQVLYVVILNIIYVVCCAHAASCSVVFTADQGVRAGKVIPLKETVDSALEGCDYVRRVYVAKRTGAEVNMQAERDVWLDQVRESNHLYPETTSL